MKIEINVSNKVFYTLIIICTFLMLGVGVYAYTQSIPNPGHGGDTVLISVNGVEKTLQQAITNGDLSDSNNINVLINGQTKSLQEAITDLVSPTARYLEVCPAASGKIVGSDGAKFCAISYNTYGEPNSCCGSGSLCKIYRQNNEWYITKYQGCCVMCFW